MKAAQSFLGVTFLVVYCIGCVWLFEIGGLIWQGVALAAVLVLLALMTNLMKGNN